MPSPLAEAAIAVLRQADVLLTPGMSPDELAECAARYRVRFAAEHAEFLSLAVPVGPRWPNWRSADDEAIGQRLAAPNEGVLFDVSHNEFWPRTWPSRTEGATALDQAREQLSRVPTLVPVYGHRYLPAGVWPGAVPVFSVHQSDVIYYGTNLLDYVRREFGDARGPVGRPTVRIPFWSDLAENN